MRYLVLLFVLATATAHAQPAMTPPQLQLRIDDGDREILADGAVSTPQWVLGAGLSLGFGFGLGQAVQGRWSKTGWIMTLGDSVGLGMILYGIGGTFGDCFEGCPKPSQTRVLVALGGLALFGGFHIWEVADAIVAPGIQNERYRRARMRHPDLFINPAAAGDGAVAGLALRF